VARHLVLGARVQARQLQKQNDALLAALDRQRASEGRTQHQVCAALLPVLPADSVAPACRWHLHCSSCLLPPLPALQSSFSKIPPVCHTLACLQSSVASQQLQEERAQWGVLESAMRQEIAQLKGLLRMMQQESGYHEAFDEYDATVGWTRWPRGSASNSMSPC
jgi:hypothetical protein